MTLARAVSTISVLVSLICSNQAAIDVSTNRLVFKTDGTFKILHISDVHYEIPKYGPNSCSNVMVSQLPCDQSNSTSFLEYLIKIESPDLVVHTGDIIDWDTIPASTGMTEFYGISDKYNLPWVASLGNHDDDSWTMTNRSKVMEYIVDLPGTLSQVGPVDNSFGNFILELFPDEDAMIPVFRTYHFDSDTQDSSITTDQVNWFVEQATALNEIALTPSLAFYHIPLEEYQTAMTEGLPFSGSFNEEICYQPTNTGLFDALKANNVKAGFCGHDHTNDFCVSYEEVKLCYEGSPGFQVRSIQFMGL